MAWRCDDVLMVFNTDVELWGRITFAHIWVRWRILEDKHRNRGVFFTHYYNVWVCFWYNCSFAYK